MNNGFYVYFLEDLNGNIFYIGKGCRHRESSHRNLAKNNDRRPVYNKIRKLWSQGSDFKLKKVAIHLTNNEAINLEKKLISVYNRRCDGGCLLNVSLGGEGSPGYKHNEESRKKLKDAWKRRKDNNYKVSEETREKIKKAGYGRKVTEETKQKLSKAISGDKHWNYGNKGATDSTRKMNEVSRKKISVNGTVFDSVTSAAKFYNVAVATAIYRAKSGKNRGGKYGEWKYVG